MAEVTVQMFIIRIIPAVLGSFYLARKNILFEITKYIDIIVIYFTIGIIVTLIHNSSGIIVGREITFGGVNYQEFSNMSALALGLNCVAIINKDSAFQLFQSKKFDIIRYIFLVIQTSGVIFGTGRGALVIICFFYLFFIVSNYQKKVLKKNMLRYFFSRIILIVASVIIWNSMMSIPQLAFGINKQLSFLSPSGGINWNETSGRLPIYAYSFNLFKKNFLFGHGINSIFNVSLLGGFSHNLYLDLLVEGGLFLFVLFITVCIFVIVNVSTFAAQNRQVCLDIIGQT